MVLCFRLHLFQSLELLSRDIRLSDLDDEHDKLALRLGIFQLLQRYALVWDSFRRTVIPVSDILLLCDNSRDRVGRPIVFIHPGAAGTGKPHDRLSMVRTQRFTA
jgi:hypothetical protein